MHKDEDCEGVGTRVHKGNVNASPQGTIEGNTVENGKKVTVDTALKALIENGGSMFD
jgi:hypothetical protein